MCVYVYVCVSYNYYVFVCARACECVFVHACIQIDKTSTHTLKSVHIQLYIRYRMDHFYPGNVQ